MDPGFYIELLAREKLNTFLILWIKRYKYLLLR